MSDIVKCLPTDLDSLSVMKNTPLETIQALLRRMEIDFVEGLPKEAYLIAWLDEFCDNRDWILRIFPKVYLDFLVTIWQSNEIEMDEIRWEMVQYLKAFGLLTYKKGNKKLKEKSEIYIVESMRTNFYFFLKSKRSQKEMERYERWDNTFCGMTYYYGIIRLPDIYDLFCQCLEEDITYETFSGFVKCRALVWGMGEFLQDSRKIEYFKNHNVEEADLTYLYINEHYDLPYCKLQYEDLKYIKDGYGIDNRWAGISDLGTYLVDEIGLSYYRATVLVHTMLTAIQNSKAYDNIKGLFDGVSFEHEEQRERAEDLLKVLYDHTPIYEYKGHSRLEYIDFFHEKERTKHKKLFTILPGGNNV